MSQQSGKNSPDLEMTKTEEELATPVKYESELARLSPARKNFLMLFFAVAQFADVCSVSGIGIAVAQVGGAIKLEISQIIWVITAYSLCFAAFLLFAGRLADLFPPHLLFEAGFLGLGVLSIAISFVTHNKYGFLILRALAGISGAMTIPSAYAMTVNMFPDPLEQKKKIGLLGLSGAVGNVLGLILAGLCMLKDWTWFFRLLGIMCLCFGAITVPLLPSSPPAYSFEKDSGPRWKRLDVVGVVIMSGSLVCFILSLTSGPISGWSSASFIAPLIIAVILAPLFFVWESRLPSKSAVLPNSIWKTTNILISSIACLYPLSFFGTSQIGYSTYFQEELHYKPIHVALCILPQGIVGVMVGGASQFIPQIITKPRYSIAIGGVLIVTSEILQVYSNGGRGIDYWKFCFPAFVIGSAGTIISFFASVVNLIAMAPPEMAGVASAWVQVVAQVGGAISLAVQSGLQGENLSDWKNSSARGFWFMAAFTAVCALQYIIFYKEPQSVEIEHDLARKRIREADLL